MKMKRNLMSSVLVLIMLTGAVPAQALTPLEKLGKLIYQDTDLSVNNNQSCLTCHHPSAGFADPVNRKDPDYLPVSEGSVAGLFGGRNAPSSAYAGFSPIFTGDIGNGFIGGMFWDGRATGANETLGDPLAEQAQGPFLNPVEMALTIDEVIDRLQSSTYAKDFETVFEETEEWTEWDDTYHVYDLMARAIAAFERSENVTRFTSRFDKFWAACQETGINISDTNAKTDLAELPPNILSPEELQGLALFNDPAKGNCAACHPTNNHVDGSDSAGDVDGYPPLFTDFTYDNLGIPVNPQIAALMNKEVLPIDYGLGGREDLVDYGVRDFKKLPDGIGGKVKVSKSQAGKFKVPTLRNVAQSAPYGHNGYFPTLIEIVNFYNTRDVDDWNAPEVLLNLNEEELGNLGLTGEEELRIVDFLKTLTDE